MLLSAFATARARQRMGRYGPLDRPLSQKRRALLNGVALAPLSIAFMITSPSLVSGKPPDIVGPRRAQAFTDGTANKVNLTINVNDFYPHGRAGPTGRTNPLSYHFGSDLAAAQAVYPFATSLTDETDWCAWMAAALALYNAAGQRIVPPRNYNYSAGTLRASGNYVINRTIEIGIGCIRVQGDEQYLGTESATSIRWKSGAAGGSASAPVYIMDCYTYDEGSGTIAAGNNVPPRPHAQLGATQPPGISAVQPSIEHIAFIGQEGDMKANSPSVSNYISGLRVRNAQFTQIVGCTFTGTLYDGVVFTAGQLFCRVSKCDFSGVHRDAIAVRRGFRSNYTTTTTIDWCEFNAVGRYDILYDTWSGVATTPRIVNNSFESRYNSYWVQNPQFWVQGVVAPVCLIGASSGTFSMNYTEGIIDPSNWPNIVATLHLVACDHISCRDNNFANVFLTAYPSIAAPRTQALINFANANHYSDITDQQNYNIGTVNDYNGSARCSNISFVNCADLNRIYVGSDGLGLINVAASSIYLEQSAASFYRWPTTTMTLSDSTTRTLSNSGATPTQVSPTADYGVMSICAPMADVTSQIGETGYGSGSYFGTWGNALWARQASDNFYEFGVLGELIFRSANAGMSQNGYKGLYFNRGYADMSAQANFLDTPLIWANVKNANGKSVGYYEAAVMTTRKNRYNFSAPPASGTWAAGDTVWNSAPVPGGYIGWVCTAGGTPGIWKGFGLISM